MPPGPVRGPREAGRRLGRAGTGARLHGARRAAAPSVGQPAVVAEPSAGQASAVGGVRIVPAATSPVNDAGLPHRVARNALTDTSSAPSAALLPAVGPSGPVVHPDVPIVAAPRLGEPTVLAVPAPDPSGPVDTRTVPSAVARSGSPIVAPRPGGDRTALAVTAHAPRVVLLRRGGRIVRAAGAAVPMAHPSTVRASLAGRAGAIDRPATDRPHAPTDRVRPAGLHPVRGPRTRCGPTERRATPVGRVARRPPLVVR